MQCQICCRAFHGGGPPWCVPCARRSCWYLDLVITELTVEDHVRQVVATEFVRYENVNKKVPMAAKVSALTR